MPKPQLAPCPWCGYIFSRRKGGCCPRCEHVVWGYMKGRGKNRIKVWVAEEPSCKAIVLRVRDLIRIRDGTPNFEFIGQAYKQNLGCAKHLLNYCNGDQQVALHAIESFFDPDLRRRFNIWVRPTSVCHLISHATGCISTAIGYGWSKVGRPKQVLIETAQLW